MPICDSFLVTEAERKHVTRRARFQQRRDAICHQVFFFLQSKAPKEIHATLKETLEEHALSYATVKNWVAYIGHADMMVIQAYFSSSNKREYKIGRFSGPIRIRIKFPNICY